MHAVSNIDINECQRNTDRCHQRATCTNTVGSYRCSCNTGYRGTGFTCQGLLVIQCELARTQRLVQVKVSLNGKSVLGVSSNMSDSGMLACTLQRTGGIASHSRNNVKRITALTLHRHSTG
jgi:hypothetical protein